MAAIIEKMKGSRIWVLATPVYWWGPTAQMKAFIDRWYAVPREVFRGKRIILTVSSSGGSIYADLMPRIFQEIITYLDMEKFIVIQPSSSNPKPQLEVTLTS